MYIKIQAQKINQEALGIVEYLDKQNTKNMVEYLNKQNKTQEQTRQTQGKKREVEYFFNSDEARVSKHEVLESLGKNHQGLRKNDSKFFMITINPSQKEIHHLKNLYGSEKEALKEYTKDVMRGYALCLNREIEGRPLTEKDLVWYGMYEKDRTYGLRDHEVAHNGEYLNLQKRVDSREADRTDWRRYYQMRGIYVINQWGNVKKRAILEEGDEVIKRGLKKRGKNAHVHVLVHRRDKSGKLSLSPLSNSKGGDNIIVRYYKDGKRIGKATAEALSVKQGKSLSEAGIKVETEKAKIGFNRVYFKQYGEAAFDHKFNYDREVDQSFWHYNTKMKSPKLYSNHIIKAGSDRTLSSSTALQAAGKVKNIAVSRAKRIYAEITPSSIGYLYASVKNQMGMDKMNQYLSMHGLLPELSFRSVVNMAKETAEIAATTVVPMTILATPVALARIVVSKMAQIGINSFKVGANMGFQTLKQSTLKI